MTRNDTGGTLTKATEQSGTDPACHDHLSPWPETGSVAFLLDVRDEFEASLLRDWVDGDEQSLEALTPLVYEQ